MIKKIILGLVVLIVLFLVGFVLYVQTFWDKKYDIAYPDLTTSTDSAVIASGKYLVTGPAHCIDCHGGTLDDLIKAETDPTMPLKGGLVIPMAPMGTLTMPNLTPDLETGIGRYDDKEIFRMLRHSVKPDGTATMNPMMRFTDMADQDLVAIVSYLRSTQPIPNKVPEPEYNFMGKMFRVTLPLFSPVFDPEPWPEAPPIAPTIERGEYLARAVANCVGCHTNRDMATFEAIGPEYAGGLEGEPTPEINEKLGVDPNVWTRSPNITPHPNSALSKFKTVESWIARFRQGRLVPTSPMHWGPFSRMSDEDLEALWLYLNSLEPVENDVGETVFVKE